MADALLDERAADVARWARRMLADIAGDDPRRGAASRLVLLLPFTPAEVAAAEETIRSVDPTGLPARCETCVGRLPMIQRSDRWHPRCTPTGETA